MRVVWLFTAGLSLAALSACQSASTAPKPLALQAPATSATAAAAPDAATQAPAQGTPTNVAFAAVAPGQCGMVIAGPPPKPTKGADFGKAAAKNVGKNVGRNVFAGLVGQAAGPLGSAVAHGVALNAVRPEQDLKGTWTATDGSATCGCSVQISSGINLQGKSSDKGKLSAAACSNGLLANAARWTLGYSFTGYNAPFDLYSAGGAKVATLNRDGMDYFSGTLADGTPVTLWRD